MPSQALTEVARIGTAPSIAPRKAGTVASGFGSAAEDVTVRRVDLNDALIEHPEATFVMRADGDAMLGDGIGSGDVLIVDRAMTPLHGHVVVAAVGDELVCRRLWRQGRELRLHAPSPDVADLELGEDTAFEFWGVVTFAIKQISK